MNHSMHLTVFLLTILSFCVVTGQSVTIKEEIHSLDTYDFGKPNPVPILVENPKIYPYFKFEEYENTSKKKDWKVVTLENDYIKVFVLPEIGGKVWGAIEKSTGEEFLYKNEVVKFRNISMRGPWTSGGIEFNFGIIGHHPSTATPVDYETRTNADGSVSCIVGNADLPSDTHWRVEIRLEADKAYFETKASWYNASPLSQSYYNWMTAAAVATYDLEFFIPGNTYVEHNGNAHSWPIDDQNRNLSFYKNNTFGTSKSYHIVGEYNDFFGGYYHDRQFGFGQLAPYEEMPGQKLWLWDLSRAGGIWEDLLTDTDGQYIEFQAGRLFDQYSAGAVNPISQVGFDPYVMDHWREIWFGYKDIGGMVDASEHGVLNVEKKGDEVYIGLNALQSLNHTLKVNLDGKRVFSEKLAMQPMEVFSKKFPSDTSQKIEVVLEGTELSYSSDTTNLELKRPFYPDKGLEVSATESLFQEACEAIEYREYEIAHEKLNKLSELDPSHRSGLVKLSEIEYRRTNYKKAIELANKVLKMDTYNSDANYMAGIAYRAQKDTLNALESLGWAARDMKHRSVSYAQMAELYLASKKYERAIVYSQKALDFNRYNLNAKVVLAITFKMLGDSKAYEENLASILDIDPLNAFAKNEKGLLSSEKIHNEFPGETLMGVALTYLNLGLKKEAIKTLEMKPTIKNQLLTAYLLKEEDKAKSTSLLQNVLKSNTDFVFPYRREMLPVLQWASEQQKNWKLKYLLAQNYLAVGLSKEGKALMQSLGGSPDSDTFYRFRAELFDDEGYETNAKDYDKALTIGPSDWKVWEENILFRLKHEKFDSALKLSKKAYRTFPDIFNIGMAHAKALLNTGDYESVIDVLKTIAVLPYEHASESRKIYERGYIGAALSELKSKEYDKALSLLERCKEWPENIGVGKPYEPDERPQDYLLALTLENMGDMAKSKSILQTILKETEKRVKTNSLNHLFGLLAAKKLNNGSLKNLVSKIELSDDSKNNAALAFFNNDSNVLDELKSKMRIPNDIWNMLVFSTNN